jgi:hypothetical protein
MAPSVNARSTIEHQQQSDGMENWFQSLMKHGGRRPPTIQQNTLEDKTATPKELDAFLANSMAQLSVQQR